MTTTVVKTIKASGGDFTTLAAFATWLNAQDLVALDIAVDCQVFIDQTAGNMAYAVFQAKSADATRYCVIRPAPGMGVNELEPTGADYGTVGIQLSGTYSAGGFSVGNGTTLSGFRITLSGALSGPYGILANGKQASPATTSTMHAVITQNRIKHTATGTGTQCSVLIDSSSGGFGDFTDNLCIADASTALFVKDGGSGNITRNTFVMRNGAAGYIAQRTYTGTGYFRANIMIDCGATPINRTNDWSTITDNFANVTITGTSTGVTVNTGVNAITRGNADSRLTSGTSPAIGAGGAYSVSTVDLLGKNRGATPDAGAIQSAALATGTITSVTANGQNVTISGTTTGSPSSATASLTAGGTPNGAVSQGPISVTLGTNTFTVTFANVPTGNYAAPTITLTNVGGTSAATGGSALTITAAGGGGDTGVTAATAVSMFGPASGVTTFASSNFTIGANGTITGTIVVTPSDGGAGGTFTPTTVSISSGTPSATFTYTPASTGAKSITVTNNGGLANPATLTYTSNPVPATALTLAGPTGGYATLVSTFFTVTANGSLAANVTVTPSDGGAGGTFTPATLTLTSTSTSATFGYTPSVVGTETISVTNDGGLTNPGSLSYVSTTPPATALTLSGPASGQSGAASSNFTVSTNGILSSSVVVTPSDGGAGGTFNPTTLTLSSGTLTGTFTYTPSALGTDTISITNNGGLTNPSNLTFQSTQPMSLVFNSFPIEGYANQASTNFTVGVINGTVGTSIVITPNDTGDTGTFTPATVTLTTGAPTATFTYTPSSFGLKSIQITNNQSLANPSQVAYTSKAMQTAISFDSGLVTTLLGCTTKTTYSTAIQTALGNTRVVKIYHDAAGGANPYVSGTKVYEIGNTGALTIVGGNITGFGVCSGVVQRSAVDLTTGTTCLRIEGNGHWVQGSLGIVGSGADFTLAASLTGATTEGFGFGTAVMNAIALLPSGTGPAVPATTVNTPYTITIEDWTTGSAVTVGSLNFDHRVADWVFEDALIAAEIGDVSVTQSTQTITFGSFEFGAIMLRSAASNTTVGNVPLEQILIAAKPTVATGWTSYPAMDTYSRVIHQTHPNPFKVKIKRQDGSVIDTIQMHDGLPINDPSLGQHYDATTAVRPLWNCGMMLPWQNTPPGISSRYSKYFNGVTAESRRSTTAKVHFTFIANIPMTGDGHNTINGYNHWYMMQQWPGPKNTFVRPTPYDPESFDPNTIYPYPIPVTGWGYEPGSISGHDWFSGPGGPRSDRAVIPTVLAHYLSDQNYVRPETAVPIKTLVDNWALAHFNHSNHWLTNVKTFASIPTAESIAGTWAFAHAYYGGGPYGGGASHTIDLAGVGNGADVTASQLDPTGKLVWGGWSDNDQHSYTNPAWHAIAMNSPIHAIAQTYKFHSQWMCALNDSGTTPSSDNQMNRVQAWRWLKYAMSWKVASKHSLGITRAQIEARFQSELEYLWTVRYKPAFIDMATDLHSVGMRNLGTMLKTTDDGTNAWLITWGGTLQLYHAHVMQFMKVTGCWDAMRARSTKVTQVLDMMIACLDKFVIDWVMATDGWTQSPYERCSNLFATGYVPQPSDVPASWAAWATANPKPNAYQNWVINASGTLNGITDFDVTQHLKAQYCSIRKNNFSEFPNANLDAAIARYQGYYDTVTAAVAAAPAGYAKSQRDWIYRYPSLGILNPTT